MKIAVLSDIHANLEALESVLIAAQKAGVDRYVVLGDVVGYGADPAACIYRLLEAEATCVLGNHDQALVDGRYARALNPLARESILHSREVVSEEEIKYLQQLAFRHIEYEGAFAHSNPVRPEDWVPMFLYPDIVWCLGHIEWRIAFVGHTHYPAIYCRMKNSEVVPLTTLQLAVGPHRYLVNPGSVGQPRDGDWRASFAVWDVEREHVGLHRVEYAVDRAQEKIINADLPDYLADRLSKGE